MSASPTSDGFPLFNWLDHRAAGVLLHPTAFPGEFGVGGLGDEARRFVDFLQEAQIRYWQVCPLGPTGYGDSPYQCLSAFAGNPYLIDPIELVEAGNLTDADLDPLRELPRERVDFGKLYERKWPILRTAFENFRQNPRRLPYGDFEKFKKTHGAWLEPFAWYQTLKSDFGGKPWHQWPDDFRDRQRFDPQNAPENLRVDAEAQRFYQYLFFGQWRRLREYARERGIEIIGDIPIFVSYDSADVWWSPELFKLNRSTFEPTAVAGVPPDYFSADGQYWGNPLFDWKRLEATSYAWWMERLRANFELYDVVRIDHFRGFESYWEIPFGAPSAKAGKWVKGPGLKFFEKIASLFPDARIIAEDLGSLTPAVFDLLRDTGLPGMAVLQFAFGGEADNFYLPHNLRPNSIVYSGTHDNDTTLGWYRAADPELQDHVRRYLRIDGEEIAWDFIRAAYASTCRLAIVPLQDLLSLDSSARFNIPGQQQGNWQWRYLPEQLSELCDSSAAYLADLAELYGREPIAPDSEESPDRKP